MQDQERWKALCEQASREQDPEKLLVLAAEIIRALDEKEHRLKAQNSPDNPVKV